MMRRDRHNRGRREALTFVLRKADHCTGESEKTGNGCFMVGDETGTVGTAGMVDDGLGTKDTADQEVGEGGAQKLAQTADETS